MIIIINLNHGVVYQLRSAFHLTQTQTQPRHR
jgi:hypothetical protein